MHYNRNAEELEVNGVLWWPTDLLESVAAISPIPILLKSLDQFISILSLANNNPFQVLDLIEAAEMPANLFLKHLCILSDYGGEPIQRLGRSFSSIFQQKDGSCKMSFTWAGKNYDYVFTALPIRGIGNEKLSLDGRGLLKEESLSNLFRDLIILLLHGSTSTVTEHARLLECEIGSLLGNPEAVEKYVRSRYIYVSKITGGAKANSLGQYAQTVVCDALSANLPKGFSIQKNGKIVLPEYEAESGMPFDIVVSKGKGMLGIEVSFQVTGNSTIERKAGQAASRKNQMHKNGYSIGYVIDGAGNFQRQSALATLCRNSDCTVAFSEDEFKVLAKWIQDKLA